MPNTAAIYLLRHGETEWNRERRIQGHGDSALTARGRAQAQANGRRLKALIADWQSFRVVASPLGRCQETARLVAAALGLAASRIELEPRLKEHGYGRWEGLTFDEAAAQDPALFRARDADRWGVTTPGGESYTMVAERVGAWLADVERDARLVVVSHGCAGRILRGLYAGVLRERIEQLGEAHTDIHRLADGRLTTYSSPPDEA